jgi:hypothetical protein
VLPNKVGCLTGGLVHLAVFLPPDAEHLHDLSQILGILAQQLGMLATSLCGFPGALLLVGPSATGYAPFRVIASSLNSRFAAQTCRGFPATSIQT